MHHKILEIAVNTGFLVLFQRVRASLLPFFVAMKKAYKYWIFRLLTAADKQLGIQTSSQSISFAF